MPGVRFKSGVELVNVTATVSDSLGHSCRGCSGTDFLVYEDNNPVEILEFSRGAGAGQPGIRSTRAAAWPGNKMEAARAALTRFTEELLDGG